MHTLDLEQAAEFLKCSIDTVREGAAAGDIPAAKVGRAWVFVDIDLVNWLRTKYETKNKGGSKKWRSEKEAKSGGSMFKSVDSELENLLS